MKYQVKFEGSFSTEDEALAFCNLIEGLKSKLFKDEQIKDPVFNLNRSFQLFKTYHDETPQKQCQLYKTVDFDGAEVVNKKTVMVDDVETLVEIDETVILSDKIVDKAKLKVDITALPIDIKKVL